MFPNCVHRLHLRLMCIFRIMLGESIDTGVRVFKTQGIMTIRYHLNFPCAVLHRIKPMISASHLCQERVPPQSSQIVQLVIMPANQMLTNLKNVSESLLGILTLLLQVLVHQIEPRDGSNDGKHVAGTAKSTHCTAKFGGQSDQSSHISDIQDLKASNFSGSIDRCKSNYNAMINMLRAPMQSLAAPASPPPTVTSQPRTVGDWGRCQVTWGKKHKGKTFLEVYQTDLGYYHWSLARFQSLPENQKDFVRYCQVRADMDSRSLSQG